MSSNLQHDRLKELFQKYINDSCTSSEAREFWELLESTENNMSLKRELVKLWYDLELKNGLAAVINEKLSQAQLKDRILAWEQNDSAVLKKHINFRRLSIAATIAVLIGFALLFLSRRHAVDKMQTEITSVQQKDIAPGGNKAILTLGNGEKIVLDSTRNGLLSVQGNTRIIKVTNGQLVYSKHAAGAGGQQLRTDNRQRTTDNRQRTTDNGQPTTVLYNTITTPRGGQYSLTLSDGTKVWLNAASSLHFPNVFTGSERKVEVTGEVYFEVAKNEKMPFEVEANGSKIEVLGTHFDVIVYKDEALSKVTLLEGAVKVENNGKELLLKPGQQAVWNGNSPIEKQEAANLQGIIAWTNGEFWFNDDDIEAVMRKLSRWYDVDVKIEGDIPQHFAGYIPRNVPFSKAFEVLQATGHLQYRMQGNHIIVSP